MFEKVRVVPFEKIYKVDVLKRMYIKNQYNRKFINFSNIIKNLNKKIDTK